MASSRCVPNWTQWLRCQNNVREIFSHRYQQPTLQSIIEVRDVHYKWTIVHGIAAGSESLGPDIVQSLFQTLECMNKTDILLMKDTDGDIAIQSAIRSKVSKNIIELFLTMENAERMLCSCNKKNQAALHIACYFRCWDTVKLLLNKCVHYNLLPQVTGIYLPTTMKCNTLLHTAFKEGKIEYFKILFEVCNEKNITGTQLIAALLVPNKHNKTPWYYAIHCLETEALENVLLCVQNANIDVNSLYTNSVSKSTILQKPNKEHYELLTKYGVKVEEGLVYDDIPHSNSLSQLVSAEQIFEAEVDISEDAVLEVNILSDVHLFSWVRQRYTLARLRKKGIFLHKTFKRGKIDYMYLETFLDECIANNMRGKQLIAILSVPNRKGETPWYHAVHTPWNETLEKVLKILEEKIEGVDVINFLYTDLKKSTMLHEAYRNEGQERVCLLKRHGAVRKEDANGLMPEDRDRQIKNGPMGLEELSSPLSSFDSGKDEKFMKSKKCTSDLSSDKDLSVANYNSHSESKKGPMNLEELSRIRTSPLSSFDSGNDEKFMKSERCTS